VDDDAYEFPYPTTLLPVPYDADTSLIHLLHTIIPQARASRHLNVEVPSSSKLEPSSYQHHFSFPMETQSQQSNADMEVETTLPFPQQKPVMALENVRTVIHPDGLLLYVANATYEPGTTPLSSWVPITAYEVAGQAAFCARKSVDPVVDPPLAMFER
jgi:snurportin-1